MSYLFTALFHNCYFVIYGHIVIFRNAIVTIFLKCTNQNDDILFSVFLETWCCVVYNNTCARYLILCPLLYKSKNWFIVLVYLLCPLVHIIDSQESSFVDSHASCHSVLQWHQAHHMNLSFSCPFWFMIQHMICVA